MSEAYNALWNMGAAAWPTVLWVMTKLNGNFPAALFGALGGSWSAYWLGVRTDRRTKLREEIAATNNAIGMTSNITNMMLSLKGQHTGPMAARYQKQFAAYADLVMNPPAGPVELVLQADFRMIAPPHTMIDTLQRTITDRVTRSPMAQMLIGSLQRAIESLARVLDQRTQLSLAMRQRPHDVQLLLYFGLPDGHGNIDDTFPDSITAITIHVDECLYYSELLMEILGKHGAALRKAHGGRTQKIVKLDLSDPRIAPLLPDRAEFSDFESQFRSPEEPSRFARLRAWVSAHWTRLGT